MVQVCSKGDKVGHPLNPAAFQGLLSAAKALLVKGKIPSSQAERSCSLLVWFDQFLVKAL